MRSATQRERRVSALRRTLGKVVATFAASAVTATTLAVGLTAGVAAPAAATPPPGPSGKGNATVVLFQWTWNSIAQECKTNLGPAGYAYVQISPPNEHALVTDKGIVGPWWTSYQPVSYKLESKLGTRAEFKAMIDTCKAAGVGIIADAVVNHMTGQVGGGTGYAGTQFGYESYPGPGKYSPQDFNDCKENIGDRYNDRYVVQNCRLVGLADLKTGSEYVRSELAGFLNDLIGLGVEGFRIDAAKHMPAQDLQAIKNKLTKPNIFIVYEVIGASGEPVQPQEYLGTGDSHEFNYSRHLKSQFDGGNLSGLLTLKDANWLLPTGNAGVFVDNHDTERNGETLNYKSGTRYKLANVFMLSYPYGWPSVYSGYKWDNKEVGPPQNNSTQKVYDVSANSDAWTYAHRWRETANMVGFYNAVGNAALNNTWTNGGGQIAYGRGDKGFVVINREGASLNRTFKTSLPAGEYCNVIAGDIGNCAGNTVTVNSSGEFTATVPGSGALAIYGGSTPPPPPVCSTDTQAPTVPTNVKATATSSSSVTVSWTASTDNNSVAKYQVTGSGGAGTISGSSTSTSFTATGLSPETAYSFTVKAVDCNDNTSAASASAKVTTPAGPPPGSVTVYYSTDKGWSTYNVHYKVGAGTWTTLPGEALAPACAGWVSKTVQLGDAPNLTAAFNNGGDVWDNNNRSDYVLASGEHQIKGGQVTAGNPCPPVVSEKPTAPKASSIANDNGAITFKWTASTSKNGSIKQYHVVRAGGGETKGRTYSGSSLFITDKQLVPNTQYWYKVRAQDSTGKWSDFSGVLTARSTKTVDPTDTKAPTVPSAPSAKVAGSTITFSYKASTDASGISVYEIVRAGGGATDVRKVSGTTLSVTDTLKANTQYWYKVRSRDGAGNWSAYSAVVTARTTTGGTSLAAPTNLKASAAADGASVTLTWTASAGAAKYEVTRTSASAKSVTSTTFTDSSTKPGTAYTFGVKAVAADGTTSTTTTVAVTTPTGGGNGGGDGGTGGGDGDPAAGPHYATNPKGQVGSAKTITIDGKYDDWSESDIIAQGVANDDPRIFRGSHEGPVYDLYALYGAWDATNLYLGWQFTNVIDAVDRSQDYPLSDNGKPYQGNIPQQIALDVDPSKGTDGILANGDHVWDIFTSWSGKRVDHLLNFSSKPNVGVPALFTLNSAGYFDYEPENVVGFKVGGISFAHGDGFQPKTMYGIKASGHWGYVPTDLQDASKYVDFLKTGEHSTKNDTWYEMVIPLKNLGITKADIESRGIGAQIVTTFGQSGIGSLPHDPATLDKATDPYGPDSSTSAEKEDVDVFTVPLARIGKL